MRLQGAILNEVVQERIPVTVYLMNGFQMRNCSITGHDTSVVVLEVDGKQQMVYKHAISTVEPSRPVSAAK